MNNSINFRGSFLIKQPIQALIKDDLAQILGKRHQVINNINENGDVLYVVNNRFDKGIADLLIKTDDAKFKYYPEVNTKICFDKQKPKEVQSILRMASKKIIDTVEKLEEYFLPKPKKPIDIVSVQANNLKTIQKENFIDMTSNDYKTNIDYQNGICSVYTMLENGKNGKKTVKHSLIQITPPDKYGISYARITPDSQDATMLAIKNGEVIFEYKKIGLETFIRNEAAAKQYYADTMSKYKADLAFYKHKV